MSVLDGNRGIIQIADTGFYITADKPDLRLSFIFKNGIRVPSLSVPLLNYSDVSLLRGMIDTLDEVRSSATVFQVLVDDYIKKDNGDGFLVDNLESPKYMYAVYGMDLLCLINSRLQKLSISHRRIKGLNRD
jgi:hypothetical protein